MKTSETIFILLSAAIYIVVAVLLFIVLGKLVSDNTTSNLPPKVLNSAAIICTVISLIKVLALAGHYYVYRSVEDEIGTFLVVLTVAAVLTVPALIFIGYFHLDTINDSQKRTTLIAGLLSLLPAILFVMKFVVSSTPKRKKVTVAVPPPVTQISQQVSSVPGPSAPATTLTSTVTANAIPKTSPAQLVGASSSTVSSLAPQPIRGATLTGTGATTFSRPQVSTTHTISQDCKIDIDDSNYADYKALIYGDDKSHGNTPIRIITYKREEMYQEGSFYTESIKRPNNTLVIFLEYAETCAEWIYGKYDPSVGKIERKDLMDLQYIPGSKPKTVCYPYYYMTNQFQNLKELAKFKDFFIKYIERLLKTDAYTEILIPDRFSFEDNTRLTDKKDKNYRKIFSDVVRKSYEGRGMTSITPEFISSVYHDYGIDCIGEVEQYFDDFSGKLKILGLKIEDLKTRVINIINAFNKYMSQAGGINTIPQSLNNLIIEIETTLAHENSLKSREPITERVIELTALTDNLVKLLEPLRQIEKIISQNTPNNFVGISAPMNIAPVQIPNVIIPQLPPPPLGGMNVPTLPPLPIRLPPQAISQSVQFISRKIKVLTYNASLENLLGGDYEGNDGRLCIDPRTNINLCVENLHRFIVNGNYDVVAIQEYNEPNFVKGSLIETLKYKYIFFKSANISANGLVLETAILIDRQLYNALNINNNTISADLSRENPNLFPYPNPIIYIYFPSIRTVFCAVSNTFEPDNNNEKNQKVFNNAYNALKDKFGIDSNIVFMAGIDTTSHKKFKPILKNFIRDKRLNATKDYSTCCTYVQDQLTGKFTQDRIDDEIITNLPLKQINIREIMNDMQYPTSKHLPVVAEIDIPIAP